MTLEQYFHTIINQPRIVYVKEPPTMFDVLKAKWTELMTTRYSFTPEPQEEHEEEGWAFVMSTPSYVNEEGETIPAKYDVIQGDNDTTWIEIVDQVLDVIGKHYGYNIKEQVYYSVALPLNHPEHSSYGRELNDEVLQKLLLSFPEVYSRIGHIE